MNLVVFKEVLAVSEGVLWTLLCGLLKSISGGSSGICGRSGVGLQDLFQSYVSLVFVCNYNLGSSPVHVVEPSVPSLLHVSWSVGR